MKFIKWGFFFNFQNFPWKKLQNSGNFNLSYEYKPCVLPPKFLIPYSAGAGDSFVAGFLYKYMNGECPTLLDCIRYGSKVAAKVIRQVGCNLPSSVPTSPVSGLVPPVVADDAEPTLA